MLTRKSFDSPVDSSRNDSPSSSPVNPELDSPKIQEDSQDLLSPKDDLDSSKLLTDTSKKKKRCFPVFGYLTIFLGIFTLGFLVLHFFTTSTNCANKAKQSEAKTYVGSMNRAQQAYYLEKDAFTNSFAQLGLGISEQTVNYQYSIRTTETSAFNYGIPRRDYSYVTEQFGPFQWKKKVDVKLTGYVGGVFVSRLATTNEMTTLAIMCEAVSPGKVKLADPMIKNGKIICPAGTKQLGGK
jgi:type IV pilus assembly protein PilA